MYQDCNALKLLQRQADTCCSANVSNTLKREAPEVERVPPNVLQQPEIFVSAT